jgi:hypothetical protein
MIHDWLLKIFQLLPHIPLTALGINLGAHYRLSDALAPKELIWDELLNCFTCLE